VGADRKKRAATPSGPSFWLRWIAYGRAAAISKTTPQTSAASPRIGGNGMVFFVSFVAVIGPPRAPFRASCR